MQAKNIAKKLKALGKQPSCFDPTTGKFTEPDYESWAQEHKIASRGTEDGREGFPPADLATMDHVHVEIESYVSELATECHTEVTQHLGDLMSRIHAVHDAAGLEVIKNRAKGIADDAMGAYQNQADQSATTLKPVLDEYRSQEEGLAEFKQKHKIGARAADYSKKGEAWLWITAIFVVESAVNAVVLADVVPAGVAGAFSMTLVITAVNVLFGALFVGEGWRDTNSVSGSTKVRGYIQVAVFFIVLLAFNILVGHGRDAMQRLEAELRSGGTLEAFASIGVNAWAQFLEDPFGFDSFIAPLLVAAGVLSFMLASWKGYERDDPYPGFGKISRRTEQARAMYRDQRDEETELLTERHNEALKLLDDLVNDAQWKRDEFENSCYAGRLVSDGLILQMRRYEGILRFLAQIYRDANIKSREGKDVPKYFSSEMTLDQKLMTPPEFSPPERPNVAGLAEVVAEYKAVLQQHYDRLLASNYPIK